MPHKNFTLYMQYMEGWRNAHVQAFLPGAGAGANNKGSREFSSVIPECSANSSKSIQESTENYGNQSQFANISNRSKNFPVPIFYDENILILKAKAFYSQFTEGKSKVKLSMGEYNCAGYMKRMFNELGIPIVGDIKQKEKALFFLTRKRPYALKNIPLPGHVYAEAFREVAVQNKNILENIFSLTDDDLKDYKNLHETEKATVFNEVFKKVLQSNTAEQTSDVSTTQSTKGLSPEQIIKNLHEIIIKKPKFKTLNKEKLLKDIQRERYNHFLEKTRFNEWFNSLENLPDPSIKKVIEDVREKYLSGVVSYSYFLEFIERNLRQIQPQSKDKKQNVFPPVFSTPMPKGLPLTEREEEMFKIDEEIRKEKTETIKDSNDLKKARLRKVLKCFKEQSILAEKAKKLAEKAKKNPKIDSSKVQGAVSQAPDESNKEEFLVLEGALFESFIQKHTNSPDKSNKEDLLGSFLGKVTELFIKKKGDNSHRNEALNFIGENLNSWLKDKDIDDCLNQILEFKNFYTQIKGLTFGVEKEKFINTYKFSEEYMKERLTETPETTKTTETFVNLLKSKNCEELWEEFNQKVWNTALKEKLVENTNQEIKKNKNTPTPQKKLSRELYDKLINNEWPDFLSEIAVKGESEKSFDNWIESLRTILTNNNLLDSYSDDTTRGERTFLKDQTVLLRATEEDNGQKSLVLGTSEHLATLVQTLVGEFSNITQVEVTFGEEFFEPVSQMQVEQFLRGLKNIPDSAQVIVKNSKQMLDRIKQNLTHHNLFESLPDQVKNIVENHTKKKNNRP